MISMLIVNTAVDKYIDCKTYFMLHENCIASKRAALHASVNTFDDEYFDCKVGCVNLHLLSCILGACVNRRE